MSLKHYRYGGSTFARTLACPGWRRLADTVVARPRSQAAADRGTLLHAAATEQHVKRLKPEQMVGYTTPEVAGQSVTQTDAKRALIPAVAALRRFIGRLVPRFEVTVEHNDVAGGTADVVAIGSRVGRIADFKFGSVSVRAHNNAQLLFYASAIKWPQSVKTVELAIIQPGARPVLDVATATPVMLHRYGARVASAVAAAQQPGAPLAKGAHCEYCPARPICPTFHGDLTMLDPVRFPHTGLFQP